MNLFEEIKKLLNENSIEYVTYHHPPTLTSEESAKFRGVPMKIGAKAILLKLKDEYAIAVMPADRRLDYKKIKAVLQSKKVRFASVEELKAVTGCDKGALPPFGHLFSLTLIVDSRLFEEEYMAFNGGSLTDSIKMKTVDYEKLIDLKKEDISSE
tara:strand:- start:698 stop:1162 length:465 start_codon:yes stop_codon:yes gene_type:complete